jgi:hypothetical protein
MAGRGLGWRRGRYDVKVPTVNVSDLVKKWKAKQLKAWLREHPAAWRGWPEYQHWDAEQALRMRRRLIRADCPEPNLQLVHQAVQELRAERRKAYKAITERVV